MKRFTAALALAFTAATCEAQQQQPAWQPFVAHSEAYGLFLKDLSAMQKAAPYDDLESSVRSSLVRTILLANERCSAVRDLLWVHDLVRTDTDRKAVAEFLRVRLGHHAVAFDNLVEMVNEGLAYTKSAGSAATANRLKDQLRSTKALIEKSRPPQ